MNTGRGGERGSDHKYSRPGGKGRYIPKRKVCFFCAEKINTIDYKDAGKLRRYISERGKIEPRRRTGVCARHQRTLCEAIKRARHLALLPYVTAHIQKTGGVGVRSSAEPRAIAP